METALMGISEFDDVQAHLLEPEESLDSEQTGIDLDEGYSPRAIGVLDVIRAAGGLAELAAPCFPLPRRWGRDYADGGHLIYGQRRRIRRL